MTLYGESSVDVDQFPSQGTVDEHLNSLTPEVEAFNSEVWKTKKEQGLSLNAEIEGVVIPDSLEEFKGTLAKMHKLL
jgi:hypothetical protein